MIYVINFTKETSKMYWDDPNCNESFVSMILHRMEYSLDRNQLWTIAKLKEQLGITDVSDQDHRLKVVPLKTIEYIDIYYNYIPVKFDVAKDIIKIKLKVREISQK